MEADLMPVVGGDADLGGGPLADIWSRKEGSAKKNVPTIKARCPGS
jgi:hypothetical protein